MLPASAFCTATRYRNVAICLFSPFQFLPRSVVVHTYIQATARMFKTEACFHRRGYTCQTAKMFSDVIVASLIITGGISFSIFMATNNRSLDFEGTACLGRKKDVMCKKLDEINKNLKRMKNK